MAKRLQEWFPHTTPPFICNAPMWGYATSIMAAAVTKAGGFGFIGGGLEFTETSTHIATLNSELTKTRELLDVPKEDSLPVGVGFLMFRPDNFLQALIPVLCEHRPAAIWLFAARDGERYAPFIPTLKSEGKSWGLKVFVQIGSVKAAREALQDEADILVVQGTDAGGHQFAQGAGLMSLLPEVVDMASTEFPQSDTVVIAAGGIMAGRGIVAAQALGAHGVVMGTRFVVTKECPAPQLVKLAMIATTDGSQTTIKHTVHDEISGTGFWPSYMDGRAIIGDTYQDFQSGLSTEENIAKYKKAEDSGDASRKILWAGAGVGMIKSELSVEDVIRNSQGEAKKVAQQIGEAR